MNTVLICYFGSYFIIFVCVSVGKILPWACAE